MRFKRIATFFTALAALGVVGMGTTAGLSTADTVDYAQSCRPTRC